MYIWSLTIAFGNAAYGVILSVAAPLDWINGNATEESASQDARRG